jgi:hypothetical protein
MKIKTLFSLLLIPAMFVLAACNREKVTTMSDDEIAETVDGTVSELDGGSALDLSSSARTAALLNNSVFCGLTGDTTLTATGPQGRYTWTGTWSWIVNCTSGTPSSISLDNVGSATFDGTNFDFTNTFTGAFEMTGLDSTFTEFTTNGTSVRVGTGSTTVRNRVKEFSYTNNLVFTDVMVKKSDYTIASGTGTAHCVGTVVDGNDFDRTASIVFNGDGTYTVTLDNGGVYTFNLR